MSEFIGKILCGLRFHKWKCIKVSVNHWECERCGKRGYMNNYSCEIEVNDE